MQRYETAMLAALQAFRISAVSNTLVKTPQLYHFDHTTGTQVLEDLTDTSDLKTVLESPHVTAVLPPSIAEPWAAPWGPGCKVSTHGLQNLHKLNLAK
jgi:hypothetical protein